MSWGKRGVAEAKKAGPVSKFGPWTAADLAKRAKALEHDRHGWAPLSGPTVMVHGRAMPEYIVAYTPVAGSTDGEDYVDMDDIEQMLNGALHGVGFVEGDNGWALLRLDWRDPANESRKVTESTALAPNDWRRLWRGKARRQLGPEHAHLIPPVTEAMIHVKDEAVAKLAKIATTYGGKEGQGTDKGSLFVFPDRGKAVAFRRAAVRADLGWAVDDEEDITESWGSRVAVTESTTWPSIGILWDPVGILAGAYLNKNAPAMLTHAIARKPIVIGRIKREPDALLCGFKPKGRDAIGDDYHSLPVTCPKCLAVVQKLPDLRGPMPNRINRVNWEPHLGQPDPNAPVTITAVPGITETWDGALHERAGGAEAALTVRLGTKLLNSMPASHKLRSSLQAKLQALQTALPGMQAGGSTSRVLDALFALDDVVSALADDEEESIAWAAEDLGPTISAAQGMLREEVVDMIAAMRARFDVLMDGGWGPRTVTEADMDIRSLERQANTTKAPSDVALYKTARVRAGLNHSADVYVADMASAAARLIRQASVALDIGADAYDADAASTIDQNSAYVANARSDARRARALAEAGRSAAARISRAVKTLPVAFGFSAVDMAKTNPDAKGALRGASGEPSYNAIRLARSLANDGRSMFGRVADSVEKVNPAMGRALWKAVSWLVDYADAIATVYDPHGGHGSGRGWEQPLPL